MPYVTKARPYEKEDKQQVARAEHPARMERQKARRVMDAKGVDRKGMDIDHKVPLSKGGTNKPSNLELKTPSQNRSFSRNSDRSVKVNKPKAK
jgi:5-methylcytosine-specific restriction endonuclease McrA